MEKRNSKRFLNSRYWTCYSFLNKLFLISFLLLIARAFLFQVVEHSLWLERSQAQAETTLKIPAYRGSIYDCRGRLLSFSVPQRSLFVDAALASARNPRSLANLLAPILEESASSIEKKLSSNRRFVWLKRHLTDQQAIAIEELKQPSLHLIDEYKRFYPYGQLGGQVLGFVGVDGEGLEGIEKSFDKVLRESSVCVGQFRDGIKQCLWLGSDLPPEPNENLGVKLSLDAFIQYVAEDELEKGVHQYQAKAGEVVVLDPSNFEVLAMANWPFFDPNLCDKRNADLWRNRTITDSFEPGSTFKVFLVSGALEEGLIKEKDRIFCENGKISLCGHTINDVHPYGWLTIPEVIKYSSNIAASKIAMQLGSDRYYRYIRGFGFGTRTGIALPGETRGLVRHHKRWRPIDLATTGFGQSIGVTALQLTVGIASLANGGEIKQPVIAKEIVDSMNLRSEPLPTKSPRRVLQKKTAKQICDIMSLVTQQGGTGVKAVPEGYTAAGKTGTAQVLDPETKRYAANKYTSIFTGFVPADHPRLVITVVVHEPRGASYGGVVAAPVFRDIAARVLPYLGVYPSVTTPSPQGLHLVHSDQKKPQNGSSQPNKMPAVTASAPAGNEKPPLKAPRSSMLETKAQKVPGGEVPRTSKPAAGNDSESSLGLAMSNRSPKSYAD